MASARMRTKAMTAYTNTSMVRGLL